MSIISTFYLGNKQEIVDAINTGKVDQLLENSVVSELDFSESIGREGLLPFDFDCIKGINPFSTMPEKQFLDFHDEILQGDKGSEGQTLLMSNTFMKHFSQLTDDDFKKLNGEIDKKRSEMMNSTEGYKRGWRIEKQSFAFYCYGAILTICALAILFKNSFNAISLIFMAATVIYWLRFIKYYSPPKTSQHKQSRKAHDWIPELAKLKEFCQRAEKEKLSLIYQWSL